MSWLSKRQCAWLCGLLLALTSCADADRVAVYRAEQMLYHADRMRSSLSQAMLPAHSEFLDHTIDAYRQIVSRFRGYRQGVEELDVIVLTAQLNIAHLEMEAGLVAEARDDFLAIFEFERTVTDARMDALFSAARISEQIEEPASAFEYYERFYGDYLSLEAAAETTKKQPAYLDAPLRLAALCRRIDRQHEEALWLQTAETLYEYLISSEPDPDVLKAARFRLLSTLVEEAKWEEALELSRSLTAAYRDAEDRTTLFLLEARIHQQGKGDMHMAEDLYRHIYEQYPRSANAPEAMLAHAALRAQHGNEEEAEALYTRALRAFPGDADIGSRAEWQLALMEEANGNWVDASLRYRSIARAYPGTRAAFEAPLRLAAGYKRLGAFDAATAAYERGVEEYRKVIKGPYSVLTRLTAEEYIARALTLLERWEEAVRHLVDVAARYPSFERARHNYITAAEICRNELGDERRYAQTLAACIQKFPGSAAAREAQERLGLLEAGD